MTTPSNISPFASGVYTLPDAAHILGINLPKLRTWVAGVSTGETRHMPAGKFITRASGKNKHFNFYMLIELFIVAQLRQSGMRMATVRKSREELSLKFGTPYPFALKGLLTDGNKLLKEIGNDALLELASGGQVVFETIIKPFCKKLDFDAASSLATRFFPLGHDKFVVVDPRHAFGRPVVTGTNIATETLASLINGGETLESVALMYDLPLEKVNDAWQYEKRIA